MENKPYQWRFCDEGNEYDAFVLRFAILQRGICEDSGGSISVWAGPDGGGAERCKNSGFGGSDQLHRPWLPQQDRQGVSDGNHWNQAKAPWVVIRIRDKGCGIEDVHKAMEPLFTTAPEEERAGLGFAVMESLMDRVKVVSHPGKGTTVTLEKRIVSKAGEGDAHR